MEYLKECSLCGLLALRKKKVWIRVYRRQKSSEIRRHAENCGSGKFPVTISGKCIELDPKTGTLTGFILHDMSGREVVRIIDGTRVAGRIRLSIPATLSSGFYAWKLTAGGTTTAGRIVVD